MSDFEDDRAIKAALYEEYLKGKQEKLEKNKHKDVYEYHINKLGDKYKIADMKDDYLINCYKYFRRNCEYKKAFGFYIEIRLRYPNDWREKIGDIE